MAHTQEYYQEMVATALAQDLDELGSSIENYLKANEPLDSPELEQDLKNINKILIKIKDQKI